MFSREKKRFKKTIISFLILLVISIPFIASNLYFPEEIHLILGKENDISFNIPITATLTPEKSGVLNINNQSVIDNINLNLDKPMKIQAEKEGDLSLKLSLFGMIPLKKMTVSVLPNLEVVPCGNSIGVRINTDGVLVLGTGYVNSDDGEIYEPSKNILKSGDLILNAGEEKIINKEQLIKYIEKQESKASFLTVKRDRKIMNLSITPVKSANDNKYKIGIWVRDATGGIGTMTYYNPDTLKFGALGHGVVDIDTKKLMALRDGNIIESSITTINKGKKGAPGELIGSIIDKNILGSVNLNTALGIFGDVDEKMLSKLPSERMPIALKQEVYEGKASIRSNISGNEIEEFEIEIQSINRYSNDDSKGMIIKITDPKLLEMTGGIVQGMSGSPILQNDKVVGAVTHVFVQDPTKGYGIFIENMIKQTETTETAQTNL